MQLNHWSIGNRKLMGLWTYLSLLIFTGCGQGLVYPNLDTAALEYNERIPLNDDFDSCLEERIVITGVQHIVGRFTRDANGRLHFGFTRNTHGTGLSQTSGIKYLLTDTVNRASLEVIAGEPRVFLEQYQGHLMRVGGNNDNDDALLHFLSKITMDANGNITSVVELERVECK